MKLSVLAVLLTLNLRQTQSVNNQSECHVPQELREEIQSYRSIARKIENRLINGKWRGFVYRELKKFVDRFGYRMTGTKNLEKSIDHMLNKLKKYNLDDVHGEFVTIPYWVRGNESATLLKPRRQNLAMLGLGYSVGTPPGGIEADAVVVNSFDELKRIGNTVKGKIVVFNESFTSYANTVKYRDYAASRAANVGAVAALIRSVTPFSLYTPHTGMLNYEPGVPQIPSAALTVEDAHMLARLQERGNRLTIKLEMQARRLPDVISRNIVADITGEKYPEKVVAVSGHIDSWDVGQGALDDGGGAFISWGALALLNKLNLRPKRTLRSILWTAEEVGLVGAQAYLERHKKDNDRLILLMESDEGTFSPLGLEFRGSDKAACILQEVLNLLKPINATLLRRSDSVGSDITLWDNTDVPTASLINKNERYFWYHHTSADTMDVLNSDDLDRCAVVWATVAYVVADLSVDLPRK